MGLGQEIWAEGFPLRISGSREERSTKTTAVYQCKYEQRLRLEGHAAKGVACRFRIESGCPGVRATWGPYLGGPY